MTDTSNTQSSDDRIDKDPETEEDTASGGAPERPDPSDVPASDPVIGDGADIDPDIDPDLQENA